MRPKMRWFFFFFKSDLSTLRGDLSDSAWHLWFKFRKRVKLSVMNENCYSSFDEEQWVMSCPQTKSAQAWQCHFTVADGIAAASRWLIGNGYVGFQCLGKIMWLNISPFSGLINFVSPVLERRKVLCKNENLGNPAKKNLSIMSQNHRKKKMGQRCLKTL